jgi:Anti-sigma-K factor rskA
MAEAGPQNQPDEAMMDLLIKQVTEGLSPDEQRELDVLDSEVASAYARDLERVAAAITLAGSSQSEPMPEALRARIESQLQAALRSDTAAARAAGAARTSARPRSRMRSTAGWWAAAACLLLAVLGWLRSPTLHGPGAQPSAEQQREALLSRPGAEKIQLDTTAEPAAAGAKADVVWDPQSQKGFVRFVGLKPNDPTQHQYQLWIFDGERDQRYPVDGGVFNVPADVSQVVVAIHAELPVHSAKAFAVTLEKPGGVVVSGREHVVAIGKAS